MNAKENKNPFNIILDSISEGVFTVDKDWRITSFNRAAEEITGIQREDAIGKKCKNILKANVCETECVLEQTIKSGKPIISKTIKIVDIEGNMHPISISTAVLKNDDGEIIGGVETFRDLTLIEELKKDLKKSYSFEDIISHSPLMQRLFDIIPQVAESISTVLIEGESGSGKELFARAIHNQSPRKKGPFLAINCSALPDSLLESELFGYKAGAFTDAKQDKKGKIEACEGGTLFLDEIGDISPAFQVKILRFLQEKTFEPLGSNTTKKANVRVITATNKDLFKLVKSGKFREDLYFRINVVKLKIPSLRNRKEDISLLVEHFIQKFNRLYEKGITGINENALSCLMIYDYPGNVRELENIIERAFVLCKTKEITITDLPEGICQLQSLPDRDNYNSFKNMETAFLINALKQNHWNKTKTAKQLGIHKTTLFRKIKALGITTPDKGYSS